MAQAFDSGLLAQLRNTQEVRIHAGKAGDKTATIWVVVAGNDVFIRSVRGPKGRWYKAAAADKQAASRLNFLQNRVPDLPEQLVPAASLRER